MNARTTVRVMVFIVFACVGPMVASADQTDTRLAELFDALKSAPSAADAGRTEEQIWSIWMESGTSEVDILMREGTSAMQQGEFALAIALFTRSVEKAPSFAEAWNKRATAYYLNQNYEDSVRDIQQTLSLEPRHFGAISGMGLIFMSNGDQQGALQAFESVLNIYPQSRHARYHVERLREVVKSEGI